MYRLNVVIFVIFVILCYFSAVCSGEITDSAGVVLSPNWPEAYNKGQDCIWGIHVEEDKRIMLDIQVCVNRSLYTWSFIQERAILQPKKPRKLIHAAPTLSLHVSISCGSKIHYIRFLNCAVNSLKMNQGQVLFSLSVSSTSQNI